ncbi:hypothetical protein FSP39_011720 [Pinctada imbricata]|uniref:Prolyl 4-hydroxylase alpha subunit domain-containing protein n=1 Tax=Pinctada imbricata TaxID=66713 RepID=A0AA89BPR9_PINIB|nr:hypothetical protein FSP39_011720 [Pinctada imbricata]
MAPILTIKYLILYMTYSTVLQFTYGEFYTSVYKLSLLISEEQRLIKALKKYIAEEESNDNTIEHELYSILQNAEDEQSQIADPDLYPQNPINAFHLIYRIQRDWPKVHSIIFCDTCELDNSAKDFDLSYHVAERHLDGLPSEADVEGATNSIIRLWNVYQFPLKDFFDGVIFGTETKPLSVKEILYIARKADVNDNLYEAFHWLNELYRRFKNGEYSNSGVTVETVAKTLAGVYNRNGMPDKSLEILEDFKQDPKLSRDLEFYKMRSKSLPPSQRKSKFKRTGFTTTRKLQMNYEALCRGNTKSSKALAQLYCYWRTSAIPYLLVKEEVVNNNPKITLFHDVINDAEIRFLQNISSSKIERSAVLRSFDGRVAGGALTEGRVSQTAWLSDFEYPLLRKLSKRIEIITGMATEHKHRFCESEEYQVLNYGVGGMYESHLDPLLTDITVGGATVFPLIKTRVPVEKGAAAFWYNFKRNGDQDFDTQHAGCPVLLGSKWVSNKWLREEGQMLRRKCGLDKDAIDTVYSNDLNAQWLS